MKKLYAILVAIMAIGVLSPYASAQCQANFGYGAEGLTVGFTNESTGGTYFTWDFGDGSALSNDQYPVHTYDSSGVYNVCLTVSDSLGNCNNTWCRTVSVDNNCDASFTYTRLYGYTYEFVSNSSNYDYLMWSFDGDTTSATTVIRTYPGTGAYGVGLTVSNSNGCSDSQGGTIFVTDTLPAPACQASFETWTDGVLNQTVYFINTSTPNDTMMAAFSWDFGDGNTSTMAGGVNTYANPGTYNVCLTVIDYASNCTSTVCDSVIVTSNNYPCNAQFFSMIDTSMNVYSYIFSKISPDPARTYTWDFGDGNTGTGAYVTYTYSAQGNYTICLTESDSTGCSATYCDSIRVTEFTCNPYFYYNADPVTNTVSFTGFGDSSASYYWNFGDENTSTGLNPVHQYASPGLYDVCLTITGDSGYCNATACLQVLLAPYTCDATFAPVMDSLDASLWFFQLQSFPPVSDRSYTWSFGDGNSEITYNQGGVWHQYSAPGTYVVCVTASDTSGCNTSYCDTLFISGSATCDASFSFTFDSTDYFKTYFTINNPVPGATYNWDFGYGATATGTSVIHTFPYPGNFYTCVTITDNIEGCAATQCQYINPTGPSSPCQSYFFIIYDSLNASTVMFNALTTVSNAVYSWDLGDGNTASGPFVYHVYEEPGYYNVCLTATDTATGCSDTYCDTLLAGGSFFCYSNFSAQVSSSTVSFNNLSFGGTMYTWDFGDSTYSNAANPVHQYTYAGIYNACLTVSDSIQGCSHTSCQTVIVNAPELCNAAFTVTVDSLNPLTVHITNTSTGNDLGYFWHFGDNDSTLVANPGSHTYSVPGTYYICLSVFNSSGCSDFYCMQIILDQQRPPCKAAFSYIRHGVNVQFSNTSMNGTSYSWDFGDGEYSTEVNPYHHFAVSDNCGYSVCLTVTDSATGCADTYCEWVNIPPFGQCDSLSSTKLATDKGTDENSSNVYIYPNPVKDKLYIESAGSASQLVIMDITGQVVHTTQVTESRTSIDIHHLPAGIYIITIEGNDGRTVSRFVKQ